jgi:hypothetical protein
LDAATMVMPADVLLCEILARCAGSKLNDSPGDSTAPGGNESNKRTRARAPRGPRVADTAAYANLIGQCGPMGAHARLRVRLAIVVGIGALPVAGPSCRGVCSRASARVSSKPTSRPR